MKKTEIDFRQLFAKMAPQAVILRSELAALLGTTDGAISQMAYRGELPKRAFPNKRRAAWFVSDVRQWLDDLANAGSSGDGQTLQREGTNIGRPRLPTDLKP